MPHDTNKQTEHSGHLLLLIYTYICNSYKPILRFVCDL